MTGYVIRRILWMIPLLWAVATITFILMHMVEGGPFDAEKEIPEAARENLEKAYNLDEPLWRQYVLYMQGILQGDLGNSYQGSARPVSDIIQERFPTSLQLGVVTFVFAITFGMTLGVLAAVRHNSIIDYGGVFFASAGAALPNFILATFLTIIFAVQLGWFDVLGWGGPDQLWQTWNPFAYDWRKTVLPVLSLGVLSAAFIARVTRASMLEVLNQDYVRTARAKGLREYRVVLRHAIKNAMIPVLTVAGPIFAFLVTGSFIVERAFQINGIGRLFVEAVGNRDYGLIMGTTIFFAFLVAFMNLIVDVLYAFVDPRIRYS
jgi:oligopeptide transport system permease protein